MGQTTEMEMIKMKAWVKLYTGAYDGSSWLQAESTLPAPDYYRAVAINSRLLCLAGLADDNGRITANTKKPLDVAAIARLLRLQVGDVQDAVSVLIRIGVLAEDEDGSYYYPSWSTYQSISAGRVKQERTPEDQRDYERKRKAAYRERRKAETSQPRSNQKQSQDVEPDLFDAWWDIYPKKEGKQAARRAWNKIAKSVSMDAVVSATKALIEDPSYDPLHRERKYIPNPATWLNAGSYEDINYIGGQ